MNSSKDVSAQGRFLRELAMVERGQPASLLAAVHFGLTITTIETTAGTSAQVDLADSRTAIAALLRTHGVTVGDPFPGEPQTIPGEPTRHEAWCETLDDLGSYTEGLTHAAPGLAYVAITHDGAAAHVTVSDPAGQTMVHQVVFDEGLPAAVPVDISGEFYERFLASR